MIVDASNQVLGRLSSEVAKKLLNGEEITIINAEMAIITGNPKDIEENFMRKKKMGDPHHGPYYPKTPNGILRRSIRGMLPYKKPRGREAFKRLKVYVGNPNNLKGEKITKEKNEIECKYLTLKKISDKLRGL